jgi:O-acetylserine/cysteine efflux transporter
MTPKHLALALLVNVLWGCNLVAGKIGVTHFPPLYFSGLRFVLVALLLVPWIRPQPGRMRQVALIALTAGALHFSLLFIGMRLSGDVSSVAIVVQLNVPFATLLAVLLLGERIGWRRALAIAVAFGGVVVIGFDPRAFGYLDGLLMIAAAAFVWALSQVLMRELSGVGVFALQGWIALISAPVMFALSFLLEEGQLAATLAANAEAIGALAYAAVLGSIFGHGAIYFLLTRYPVSTVSPMLLLTPIVGVVAGVVVLGDVVTLQIAFGGVLTIAGVAVVTLRGSRAPAAAAS